jgi:hypothetical protein
VSRSDGILGKSYSYDGAMGVAQDTSNFYIYETDFGFMGSHICIVSKNTYTVSSCPYNDTASVIGIAVSGSTLWWIDMANVLGDGTTGGATATEPDMGAGAVLAADATGLVWSEASGTLLAAPVNNVANQTVLNFAGIASRPQALVIDATYAYWYNAADLSLYRTARDNSGYLKLASLSGPPGQLAVDSTYVYWTDPSAGKVWRVAIDAKSTGSTIATAQPNVSGIAVDGVAIFWSSFNATSGSGQLFELAK